MIACVGGGKTGILRTIIHEYPHLIDHLRIPAGPQTKEDSLDQVTANQVADNCSHDKAQNPPATPDSKIIQCKYQQEKIKEIP